MTLIKPIPPVAIVQAISRNGEQPRQFNSENMRQALAIRGQDLPENQAKYLSQIDQTTIKKVLFDAEKKHTQLKFELHDALGRILISVIDRDSGELILQVPGEEAIAMAEHLQSIESGKLHSGVFLNSTI